MGLGVVRHLVTDAGREDELTAIRQLGVQFPFQTQQTWPFEHQ